MQQTWTETWTGAVAGYLGELKRDGLDFDESWTLALLRFPPRGRDIGEYRPTLIPRPGDGESVVEFFRRACDDAWHGRRQALRNFSVSAMRDAVIDGDGGGSAGPLHAGGKSRAQAYAA